MRKSSTDRKPSPALKRLQISVDNNDDWYVFFANLLSAGREAWLQEGRNRRAREGDPTLPTFETWAQWKKALLRAGRLYWEAQSQRVQKPGRPNKFSQCWRAFRKSLHEGIRTGRYKIHSFGKDEWVIQFKDHPITQGEVARMIGEGDPSLQAKTREKYSRALHIIYAKRFYFESDIAFITKHISPLVRRIINS